MTNPTTADTSPKPGDGDALSPLPGEAGIPNVAAARPASVSIKGLLAVVLLVGTLLVTLGFAIQRVSVFGKKADGADITPARDKPAAATAPHRLELPAVPATPATPASAAAPSTPRIPALVATEDEAAEPIGVRRTGSGAPASAGTHSAGPTSAGTRVAPPEDAPILLVGSRPGAAGPGEPHAEPGAPSDPMAATTRNLQDYQRQLQGLLNNLTATAAAANAPPNGGTPSGALLNGPPGVGTPTGAPALGGPLFGGQLMGSSTPRAVASLLGNRSLTLPKGTAFTCALKTKVISATSGLVGCQVQRNVFSDDGRVLLIERGSHLDGEYRIASVRPGTIRIPVLWTRIRTPLGVTVDLDSPGTGPLGESGIDGHVDNRWGERIGAAMLLSLIDDSVKLVIQNQASASHADTIVLPSTAANTSKLAEKVLDSTINIPPLVYQNQGGLVGIYVARDVDFSSVYELRPTASSPAHESTP